MNELNIKTVEWPSSTLFYTENRNDVALLKWGSSYLLFARQFNDKWYFKSIEEKDVSSNQTKTFSQNNPLND